MNVNNIIAEYANANWITQYLGSDGRVHNRLMLKAFGHKIDLIQMLNKSPLSQFFKTEHAALGFAKASQNLAKAIEEDRAILSQDRKTQNVYIRAIEKLNRLHCYVNDCDSGSRIKADLIDVEPLQKCIAPAPAAPATPTTPEIVDEASPNSSETPSPAPEALVTLRKNPDRKAKQKTTVTIEHDAQEDKALKEYRKLAAFEKSLDSFTLEEQEEEGDIDIIN